MFEFKDLRTDKNFIRAYKPAIYSYIEQFKGYRWTILDAYEDSTEHRYSHLLKFLTNIKSGYINRKTNQIYVESISKEKYIIKLGKRDPDII